MGFFHAGDDAQGLPEIRGYGGIGRHAGFRFQWATVQVQVLLPAPPRQKNSAPFRFRGLRKRRENCSSAASFFLFQIGPASLGSDLEIGLILDSSRALPPRQRNAAPFRFRGLRKSRENCSSAASFFLSKSEDSRGSSDLVFIAGSDLDCPGAPRQKKLTPFRFPGFRKSQESSISVSSFFLSETGVSQGTPVSGLSAGSDLDSPR